eukprot:3287660-Amphidinium_carterae.1
MEITWVKDLPGLGGFKQKHAAEIFKEASLVQSPLRSGKGMEDLPLMSKQAGGTGLCSKRPPELGSSLRTLEDLGGHSRAVNHIYHSGNGDAVPYSRTSSVWS